MVVAEAWWVRVRVGVADSELLLSVVVWDELSDVCLYYGPKARMSLMM